jgi:GTP cyclohydrolase I
VERWATFDCYGTLIDWDRGIGDALASLWPDRDRERLLLAYHRVEPEVQAGSSLPYREVMAEALRRLAREEGLPLAPDQEDALAASLPDWPPFPEVPGALEELRRRGWRLAILSNTDPDLLEASVKRIGVEPDLVVTAAEAGSYKPAHGHWERFFEVSGADRERHVHVAASPFHDLAPCAELGLRAVWVNRKGERSELPRAAELPDLSDLPDTLDALVPAAEAAEAEEGPFGPERRPVDRGKVARAVRLLLEAIGEDPDRPGLAGTPARVADMFEEVFAGVGVDPREVITVVPGAGHDEMIMVRDIPLVSMCEHHVVPFIGKAHVAYVPNRDGRITGLSKIARVVDILAKRLQVQERLTTEIADALESALQPRGVFVMIEAEHLCMTMRGVKKPGAVTTTSAVRGVFRTDARTRAEALELLRRGHP